MLWSVTHQPQPAPPVSVVQTSTSLAFPLSAEVAAATGLPGVTLRTEVKRTAACIARIIAARRSSVVGEEAGEQHQSCWKKLHPLVYIQLALETLSSGVFVFSDQCYQMACSTSTPCIYVSVIALNLYSSVCAHRVQALYQLVHGLHHHHQAKLIDYICC